MSKKESSQSGFSVSSSFNESVQKNAAKKVKHVTVAYQTIIKDMKLQIFAEASSFVQARLQAAAKSFTLE